MKTYSVNYHGNSTRFQNFLEYVNASSEREAVEKIYSKYLNDNYFPQEDGTINDCDGNEIASGTDEAIEYDGGIFYARLSSFNRQ